MRSMGSLWQPSRDLREWEWLAKHAITTIGMRLNEVTPHSEKNGKARRSLQGVYHVVKWVWRIAQGFTTL